MTNYSDYPKDIWASVQLEGNGNYVSHEYFYEVEDALKNIRKAIVEQGYAPDAIQESEEGWELNTSQRIFKIVACSLYGQRLYRSNGFKASI